MNKEPSLLIKHIYICLVLDILCILKYIEYILKIDRNINASSTVKSLIEIDLMFQFSLLFKTFGPKLTSYELLKFLINNI